MFHYLSTFDDGRFFEGFPDHLDVDNEGLHPILEFLDPVVLATGHLREQFAIDEIRGGRVATGAFCQISLSKPSGEAMPSGRL
jgi:hypothetical protein